jgi:Transposase DDE domain group 1
MVKSNHRKKAVGSQRIVKITPETEYAECSERLTAFGGLLALVKFLDLIGFQALFAEHYTAPGRKTQLGHSAMVSGILMLLFIGFQRLGHFAYLRGDAMLCGVLKVSVLPAVSTFWRYLQAMGLVQSQSLLRLGAALRKRVWQLCHYAPRAVQVNIDTTVSTVYGAIEGARKGHNRMHRGKKALRPVLCFLDQTREYLCGTQRRGQTMSGEEVARQIRQFRRLLPDCVQQVTVCGDSEFIGHDSVAACLQEGFCFIFGNKVCAPHFDPDDWYRYGPYEYNQCWYHPKGWSQPCRFVAMRIHQEQRGNRQLRLLDNGPYLYRVFVTNHPGRPHQIIAQYDQRAVAEALVAEAQREGLLAIPSKRFHAHHAFFQIVMLAYNLWRWMKWLASQSEHPAAPGSRQPKRPQLQLPDHTIRIARLKMLYVAAKIVVHSNSDQLRYSVHEQRAAGLMDFLQYLDRRRAEAA